MGVRLRPYDPGYPHLYLIEAGAIDKVLGTVMVAIHHIGSTAIPGICAKPVIDILVEVTTLDALDNKAAAMEARGYKGKGEHGIPGRRYFSKSDAAGEPEFHVHAFAAGSAEVARHLDFRDYLRAHPGSAGDYSRLKAELAQDPSLTRRAYAAAKAPFIEDVLRRAASWRQAQ